MKLKTFLIFALLLLTGCAENDTQNRKTVRVSAPQTDAAEPAVAAAPDGGVFIVWVEHDAGKASNVYLQKFDAQGKPGGEKITVNPNAGTATAWRGDAPTIVVGADNKVFIGWTASIESADGHAADIMLSVSRDGGRTFDAPTKVNDDKIPAVHGMHSLAVDKNGKIYVAWLDERYLKNNSAETQTDSLPNNFHYEKAHQETQHETRSMQHGEDNREVYFAASSDGGKTFSPNKKLAGNVCPCCKTALLATPDNNIYVAWRQVLEGDFRHIAVAASSNGGDNFAPATIVSDDHWQIAGCPVSGATLAGGANNMLKVVWFTAGTSGTTGIYEAQSSDGGKVFSERELISAGTVFGTPVLLSDTAQNLATIWSADGKILIANSDGQKDELGAGELPSAAFAGQRLFTAFVKRENDKRAVWLLFGNK